MQIDILTLFPKMFESVFNDSIIWRAQKRKIIKINIHNLRDWTKDKHKTVDDKPYGGGAGMLLKVDVIDRAIRDIKLKNKNLKLKIILLTPQGKTFNQKMAKTLTQCSNLLLICGHYEGFDERIRKLVDQEISIGNYVLTGGEIPAMVLVETISRLVPGVIGKKESSKIESFSMNNFVNDSSKIDHFLEYPQYTKPENFQPISKKIPHPLKVPKILLSGNHQKIKNWRISKTLGKSLRKK